MLILFRGEHGAGKLTSIVLNRATDFETQRRIWDHHEAAQAKQWINYDVFYQAALKVGRLTPA